MSRTVNTDNLKPFDTYDPDDLRAVSSKAGKRSGESRRERRKLKEELTAILESGDAQSRICTALVDKATGGDPRAFEIIRDTLGEKAADMIRVESEDKIEQIRNTYRDSIIRLAADEMRAESEHGTMKYGGLYIPLCDLQMKREAAEIFVNEGADGT